MRKEESGVRCNCDGGKRSTASFAVCGQEARACAEISSHNASSNTFPRLSLKGPCAMMAHWSATSASLVSPLT